MLPTCFCNEHQRNKQANRLLLFSVVSFLCRNTKFFWSFMTNLNVVFQDACCHVYLSDKNNNSSMSFDWCQCVSFHGLWCGVCEFWRGMCCLLLALLPVCVNWLKGSFVQVQENAHKDKSGSKYLYRSILSLKTLQHLSVINDLFVCQFQNNRMFVPGSIDYNIPHAACWKVL